MLYVTQGPSRMYASLGILNSNDYIVYYLCIYVLYYWFNVVLSSWFPRHSYLNDQQEVSVKMNMKGILLMLTVFLDHT